MNKFAKHFLLSLIPQNPEEQKNPFLMFLIPREMKFGKELQTLPTSYLPYLTLSN